jgi:epsilon-lactone hydrolase
MKRLQPIVALGLLICAFAAAESSSSPQAPTFNKDAVADLPAFRVPYSDLASPEAKANLLEFLDNVKLREGLLKGVTDPVKIRKVVDDVYIRPLLQNLRHVFSVDIKPEIIGGVQTDIVTPTGGISTANKNRVLINLHGGGFTVGARYIGQVESVPIASIGAIKVVTVDYRMAPEAHFPAASEDVAKVYAELLKSYRPENIGIYGCSAGAVLTAQSTAWLQTKGLPRPGAIAMSGGGALVDRLGDSAYVAAPLGGYPIASYPPKADDLSYMAGADARGPTASPAYHDAVLKAFPPSLFISGTRDMELSPTVYTHARLVDLGVDAELHVFEGQQHCFLYFDIPESHQAWRVMATFFEHHLGDEPK